MSYITYEVQVYSDGEFLSEEDWKKKLQPDPCANKIVEIEGKKYKLVPVEEK
jgi:hypothetical protein